MTTDLNAEGRAVTGEAHAAALRYAAYVLRCWQDQGIPWPCPDGPRCDHPTDFGCLAAALDKEAS